MPRWDPEACNGRDDDCDALIDEELPPLRCGAGSCAREVAACTGGVPGECIAGDATIELCNGSWGGLAWTVVSPDLSRSSPPVRATTGGCPELGSILPGGTLPRAILAFNCLASEGAVAFFDASICPR